MGKAWCFFSEVHLVSRSTPGKLPCSSNVLSKWKFLKKYIGLSPLTNTHYNKLIHNYLVLR